MSKKSIKNFLFFLELLKFIVPFQD